jgi:hypothetical protein
MLQLTLKGLNTYFKCVDIFHRKGVTDSIHTYVCKWDCQS